MRALARNTAVFVLLCGALLCRGGILAQQGGETGPDPVVYQIEGEDHNELGLYLALLGDVDGDGIQDFAASRLTPQQAPDVVSRIDIFSGKTGTLIRSLLRLAGVVQMPDLDGDGDPELGAVGPEGLNVISPRTGEVWYKTRAPFGIHGVSGPALTLPDLDGDGVGEFAYGDPKADFADNLTLPDDLWDIGRLSVLSGKTGRLLWFRQGAVKSAGLGRVLVLSGDHDGDGVPDILTYGTLGEQKPHTVSIFSTVTGEMLRSFWPGEDFQQFGRRMASLGDHDGDGFPEVAIAASWHKEGSPGSRDGGFKGWVGIFRMPDFELERSFVGRDYNHQFFAGDQLGTSLSTAGDADGDGIPDLLIGTHRSDANRVFQQGRLYLHSGATGEVLTVYGGPQELRHAPLFALPSPLDDLDGDGRDEFLVASHQEDLGSPPAQRNLAGSIRALRYDPTTPRFIRGDTNDDGRVNITDVYNIVRALFEPTSLACPAAYDVDVSGTRDLADVWGLIYYLFRDFRTSGLTIHAPAPPYPECGTYTLIEPIPFVSLLPCAGSEACAE